MNRDEKIAKKFIETHLREVPDFEPNGNVPPDFSLNANIGIEVRRLNQNYFGENNVEGLEQVTIPLYSSFEEVLRSFDDRYNSKTFGLSLEYRRPLEITYKDFKNKLETILNQLIKNPPQTRQKISIDENIKIVVFKMGSIENKVFIHALGSDHDSSGWVLSILESNIGHCIEEKTEKIRPYLNDYKQWWLLLVNYLPYLSSNDTEDIESIDIDTSIFKKVFILNPNNSELITEF